MTEKKTRKQPEVGETYGEWTIVGKPEPVGDRKRRWTVENALGIRQDVLQTDLSDLALAKKLKDKAEAADAAKLGSAPLLTPEQAEENLLAKLDAQIAEAQETVKVIILGQAPFDLSPRDLAEIAAGVDPFALTPEEIQILECPECEDEVVEPVCVDCVEGNHPDDGGRTLYADPELFLKFLLETANVLLEYDGKMQKLAKDFAAAVGLNEVPAE